MNTTKTQVEYVVPKFYVEHTRLTSVVVKCGDLSVKIFTLNKGIRQTSYLPIKTTKYETFDGVFQLLGTTYSTWEKVSATIRAFTRRLYNNGLYTI